MNPSPAPSPAAPTPPTAEFLHDLLEQLQPPHLPISPHLLSTDLKTRHLYLPPSAEQPDAYLKQRPDAESAIYDALEHIASEWEAVEQQGQHAGLLERIGGQGNVRYCQVDEHTVLCLLEIAAPDVGGERGTAVTIKLVHEGSAGWLLFDTDRVGAKRAPEELLVWSRTPEEAQAVFARSASEKAQRNPRPEELDDDEDNEDGSRWDGNGNAGDPRGGAEDFWGGYSDDEKADAGSAAEASQPVDRGRQDDLSFTPNRARGETIRASDRVPAVSSVAPVPSSGSAIPPPAPATATYPSNLSAAPSHPPPPSLSRQASSSSSDFGAGDNYWSAYAGVEDGLRASNPPSRIGSVRDFTTMAAMTPRMQQDGRGDGCGGTGADTPVRWTPEPSPGMEDGEIKTPPTLSAAKMHATGPGIANANGAAPSAEAEQIQTLSEAEKDLEATLRGVLAMYAGRGTARSAEKAAQFWAAMDRIKADS